MFFKQVIEEDFINYKEPSMFIAFTKCDFKCDKECGEQVCQNSALALSQNIDYNIERLAIKYVNNPITSAIVIGGLEPFDTFMDLIVLINEFRIFTNDDIIIYTGYNKDEIQSYIDVISKLFNNIIVKFGRFIPNQKEHYDTILGIKLQSDNQYAERIS